MNDISLHTLRTEDPRPVAVLFGGQGQEHPISCESGAHLCDIVRALSLPLLPIGIARDGAWYRYRGEIARIRDATWATDREHLSVTYPVRLGRHSGFFSEGRVCPVRAAIPALHGERGEDGEVQGALITAGIPCAGADVRAGALTSDKTCTKIIAAFLGIPTTPYLPLPSPCMADAEDIRRRAESLLGYPMILKPARRGSSIGIRLIRSAEEFLPALSASLPDSPLLIERFLSPVTELECAYLDGTPPLFTPPAAVRVPDGFYDYTQKYGEKSRAELTLSPPLPASVTDTVRRYAASLVSFLGIRGLSRIDFFLTGNGTVLFNEINSFPGMTDISLFPKMLAASGIGEDEMLLRLLAVAEGAV